MRLLLLLFLFASAVHVSAVHAAPRIVEGDGLNLQIVRASDSEILLSPKDKKAAHNWFAATLENLPI